MHDRTDDRTRLAAALAASARAGEAASLRRDEHPDDVAMALYVAGELEPASAEALERHVAACTRCAADVATAAQVELEARAATPAQAPAEAAPALAPTPAPVHGASRAATAVRPAPARPRRRLRRLAIAAGIAVIATAGALAAGARMALDRLQPMLVADASKALDRGVSVRGLGVTLAGGPGVSVDGLRIADDERFAQESFLEADHSSLSVDVAALLRGKLYGSIALDDAVVRLVRGPGGVWNVQTLGDRSGRRAAAGPAGAPPRARPGGDDERDERVRLTSVEVRDGRVEIADRSGAATRNLVLREVDLDVRSPDATRPARVRLDGIVGAEADGRTVVIDGQVGPFAGGESPRWQLDRISLERIPLADIPGAPASLRGELSFAGRLESSGDAVEAVVANARGGGDLQVCCGSLATGNLARDVVAALGSDLADRSGAAAFADAVLAAAAREPAVAAVLAAPETAFRNVGGAVDLTADALAFRDLALTTTVLTAESAGTLSRAGAVAVSGSLALEPGFAAVVAQAAPALRPLVGSDGKLSVPFRASGTWPKIAVEVDVARAVAAADRLDPRALMPGLTRAAGSSLVGRPMRPALLARIAG